VRDVPAHRARWTLLAITLLVAGGCGGAEPKRDAPQPRPPRATAYPVSEPVALAADDDGVWVLNGAGELRRLDNDSSDPGAPLRIASGKHARDGDALALDGDTLWLADEERGLLRLDSRTGEPRGRPLRLGHPVAVAVGGGAVWVPDAINGNVRRVDPRTLRASRPIRAGGEVRSVAASDAGVWAVDQEGEVLAAIDPKTLAVTRRAESDGTRPGHAAAAADAVWMGDDDGATVFDAGTLSRRGRWQAGVSSVPAVAADAHGAWGVNSLDPVAVELDPATGRARRRVALPGPGSAVALSPSAVWIAALDRGAVYRLPR
jgi:DNA-binding beta-propeller fold protein YncE